MNKFNQGDKIPIKILMSYFIDLDQLFQKFIWNQICPQIASTTLRKNEVGGITMTYIK